MLHLMGKFDGGGGRRMMWGFPGRPHARACREEGAGDRWCDWRDHIGSSRDRPPHLSSEARPGDWGSCPGPLGSHQEAGSRLGSGRGGLETGRPGKRLERGYVRRE